MLGSDYGTDAISPYRFTGSNLAAGTYALTAKDTGNQGSRNFIRGCCDGGWGELYRNRLVGRCGIRGRQHYQGHPDQLRQLINFPWINYAV